MSPSRRYTFSRPKQAWYASAVVLPDRCVDEVRIQVHQTYDSNQWDEATQSYLPRPTEWRLMGEFGIRWWDIFTPASPRLEVFDDGWAALLSSHATLGELMRVFDGAAPTPDEVCEFLQARGWIDGTERHHAIYNPEPPKPKVAVGVLCRDETVAQTLTDILAHNFDTDEVEKYVTHDPDVIFPPSA